MTKEEYLKAVEMYNKDPNICLCCGKPIFCKDEDHLSVIKKKKFCNSSCSASYNNKGICRNKEGKIENLNRGTTENYLNKFTDEEILYFYNSSRTLKEFSQKLGYKGVLDKRSKNVFNRLDKLKINLDKFNNKNTQYIDIIEFKNRQKIHYCKNCGKKICHTNKSGYCSECYKKKQDEEKIAKWLETGDTGCMIGSNIRNCIRDYIYNEQNYKCAICNCENEWNGKELKFILDHIDGDAGNNTRKNLRLICPNCDSQLDTYKSKNKNSARNFRHKYYELYNNAG